MPTSNLGIVYMTVGQTQKEVTFNNAMDKIDAMIGNITNGRGRNIYLMAGETPAATGAGDFEAVIPWAPDGSSMTLVLKKVFFRLKTAGTSASTLQVERSTGTGAFAASSVLTAALSLASGVYEGSTSSFVTAQTTMSSGDKVRVNVSAIGTGSVGWTLMLIYQLS